MYPIRRICVFAIFLLLLVPLSAWATEWDRAIWDQNNWDANTVPVAVDVTVTTNEDTLGNGTLQASDADGNPLTYQIVSNGTKGVPTLTNATTGAFTYAPFPNANGTDTFTFKANDGLADSVVAKVTVTIVAINDPPTASNGVKLLNESATHAFSVTDFGYYDVEEGAPNKIKVIALPAAGQLSLNGQPVRVNDEVLAADITAGRLIYSPPQNLLESTSVTIQYQVNDGTAYSVATNTVTVAISQNAAKWDNAVWDQGNWVSESNNPPVTGNGRFETDENRAVSGTLQATDPEGSSLTFQVVSQGKLGTATLTDAAHGSFTYAPAGNLNGTDTFTIRVSDGTLYSNTATVTVEIHPGNRAPVADNVAASTNEDTPYVGKLNATDSNNDPLVYRFLTEGTLGKATITNAATGAFQYVSGANLSGKETLTYSVSDGRFDSNPATLTVTIVPVNDPPIAMDGAIQIQEDSTGVTGSFVATDVEKDALTYSIVSNGQLGTATITNAATGAFAYKPNADANGVDTVRFKANDGKVDSNVATMTITIRPVNDIPQPRNGIFTTDEDTESIGTLLADHPDAHATTFAIVKNGSKGTASLLDAAQGIFSYKPNPNANGPDFFLFKVSDAEGESSSAQINVTINPGNDAPVATDGTVTTKEDTPASGQLLVSDVDSDQLTYSIVTNGTLGKVVLTDASTGAYTYTPNNGAIGKDTFTFKANDKVLDSNTATVTVTISGKAVPTITSVVAQTIDEDQATTAIAFTIADADTEVNSLQVSASSTNLTLVSANAIVLGGTGANRTVTITPAANQNGTADITLTVSNGALASSSRFVLTVRAVNDAPVATDGAVTTNEDTPANSYLMASDVDSDQLTYSIMTNGTLGQVVLTDAKTGAYTYTPNANANGTDTFTFRVHDGTVFSNTASVAVTIVPVDDAPQADDATLQTDEDTSVNGRFQAHDPDGGPQLTYSIVANGTLGNAFLTDKTTGTFTYTPSSNKNGADRVVFQVSNGKLTSNTATVTITIHPVNDAPTLANDFMQTMAGITNSVNLLENDTDPDQGDTLTITSVTQGSEGSVELDLEKPGFVSYRAVCGKSGNDHFTYTVTNGHGGISTGTVTVWIDPCRAIDTITFPEIVRAEAVSEFSVVANDAKYVFWDFGDGTTGSGAQVKHTYKESGLYIVTTTVVLVTNELSTQTRAVWVLTPRYTIQGTVSGLMAGDTLRVTASSNAQADFATVELTGTGQDLAFTLDDMTPASDYKVQWFSEKYPSGYWGGEPHGSASSGVLRRDSSTLDLSRSSISGVNIRLSGGRSMTVNLTAGSPGDSFDVTVWSRNIEAFKEKTVTFDAQSAQVVLKALPPASDYLLHIEPLTGSYRAGYYGGEGRPLMGYARAMPLDLAKGEDLTVGISLTNGFAISGTINDLPAGKSAWIDAWSRSTNQGKGVELLGTGKALTYRIAGLTAATDYRVCLDVEDLVDGCYAGTDSTELVTYTRALPMDLSKANRDRVDFTVRSGQSIAGTITGFATGDEVAIDAWSTSAGYWTTTQMKSDGSYLLDGLPPAADYKVTVDARGYQSLPAVMVDVTAGNVTTTHFELSKGGRITGTITGLQKGDVVEIEARSKTSGSVESVLTAKDALPLPYTLEGIGADGYVVSIQTPKGRFYYSASEGAIRGYSRATELAGLVDGVVSAIHFDLSKAASYSLSGTISGLDTTSTSDLSVTVTAFSAEGGFGSTIRSGDGAFTIGSLPAGSYTVTVAATGFTERYFSSSSPSSWSESQDQATLLEIKKDTANLSVTLTQGSTISGVVKDATGKPLKEERVSAWNTTLNVGGSAMTLADGSYKIEGLPKAVYDLDIRSQNGVVSTKGVDVTSGDLTNQDLTLVKQIGKISGKVSGTKASGAMVLVYDEATGHFIGTTVADKNGNYTINNLATGKHYRVDVEANDDFSSVEGTASVLVDGGDTLQNFNLNK